MNPATSRPDTPQWSREEREAVERLARAVVRRRLAPVAALFIESARPLNFVASQMLVFFGPMVQAFGEFRDYDTITRLLEDRRSIDLFLKTLGRLEEEEAHASPKS